MADIITLELELAVQSLEERGFRTIYRPTAWDDDSFYRIVSHVKWQSFGHPKSARSAMEKVQLEKDHQQFFLAFEPPYDLYDEGKVDPKAILKTDLNNSKTSRAVPTRRDMYAAAEFLQRSIHMIYWYPTGVQKEIIDPPFTSYETEDIIYILSVSQQNKTAYVRLTPTEGFSDVDIAKHSQCQELAFRRSFSHRLYDAEKTNTELIGDEWMVDQSVDNHQTSNLFYSMSKAMYGFQDYHEYVRELIITCLREDELAEAFFDSTKDDNVSETLTLKEKVRKKTENRRKYISDLQNGQTTPGTAELYTAAYLYRTEIFMERKDRNGWDVYHPLSLPRNRRTGASYITLTNSMRLRIPTQHECSCMLERPPVECLESINSDILKSLAFKFVVSQTSAICCPGRKHQRHIHLDRFCNKTKTEDTRNCSSFPAGIHIDGRTLDKVTEDRATFRQCIHKLIYGTDDVSDDFEVREEAPDDEYLLHIARWLEKIIYVYSSRTNTWRVYRPDVDPINTPQQRNGSTKQCRYYITLLHDYTDDRYDIITPIQGCNCIMRPPAVNTKHTDARRFISKDDRHIPLTEFFLDDGIGDSFSDETQNRLSKEGYSQIHEVFHRPDMQLREVDKGHATHSLYTCLSKEIFGNEEQARRIEELVAKEMQENAGIYASLLGVRSNLKRSKQLFQNEVDKTLVPFLLLFGHLPLLAAATVFQTPIYVLNVEWSEEKKWRSSWSSFTQVRKKTAPHTMPKIQSQCRQNGKFDRYYVTLLQDPYGNFLRIVPKREVCNCEIHEPDVPGEFVSAPQNEEEIRLKSIASRRQMEWEVAENKIIHKFRRLDNALGQNLRNIRQMMELISTQLLMHDLIVAVFESRRRNINIASITGSSVSTVGAGLLILGFALAPVTGGATLSLSVAGGVISGLGSASVIGAKITEGALTKHQLHALVVIHELLDVLSKEAAQSNQTYMKKAKKMMTTVQGDVGELGDNTSGIVVGMSPALGRFMGSFHIVPVIIARVTAQVSSIIVGSVVGGISVLVDAMIIAHAAHNLNKGNKTDTSEMIRKNADLLRAIKVKLESYVHGYVY